MRRTTMSDASRNFAGYRPSNHESTLSHQWYVREGLKVIENIMTGIDPNCGISLESQMLALQYQRGNLPTS